MNSCLSLNCSLACDAGETATSHHITSTNLVSSRLGRRSRISIPTRPYYAQWEFDSFWLNGANLFPIVRTRPSARGRGQDYTLHVPVSDTAAPRQKAPSCCNRPLQPIQLGLHPNVVVLTRKMALLFPICVGDEMKERVALSNYLVELCE